MENFKKSEALKYLKDLHTELDRRSVSEGKFGTGPYELADDCESFRNTAEARHADAMKWLMPYVSEAIGYVANGDVKRPLP